MSHNPAVPYPVIAPSELERNAIAELMPKLDTADCENKAAQIKAASVLMFEKKIEPTEVPTFVQKNVAVETRRLQAEIDRLQRKPETA